MSQSAAGKPVFTLSSYEPVKLSLPTPTVSEDEINRTIETLLFQSAELKPVEEKRKARPGEIIVANLETFEGEKAVDELTGTEFLLDVGLGLMPQVFEAAVMELEEGDNAEVTYEIPVGRTFTSKVKMLGLRERILPALTDAWVQEKFGHLYSNIPEFAAGLHTQLIQQKKDEATNEQPNLIADELVARLNEEVPQELLDAGYEAFMSNFDAMLQLEGTTREKFIEEQGVDPKTFEEQERAEAALGVRRGLALDAMARHLGITIEDENEVPALLGIDPSLGSQLIAALKKDGSFEEALESAIRNKTLHELIKTTEISFY